MIDILLSTYNGERFIRDFIASLAKQSCRDFELLIRDDGSDDDTVRILESCLAGTGIAARFVTSSAGHVGVVRSFGELLPESRNPYVMFADQDDVWHPEKVAEMLNLMRDAERKWGEKTPLLLHSDLRVCGEHGESIADSFIRYQKLSPENDKLSDLLVQNHVTGCATMINSALKELVRLPFPPGAICHDWYLAILAAATGRIVFSETPYVDYRQHDANVYGSPEYSLRGCAALFRSGREALNHRLALTQAQARDFLGQYGDLLSPADRTTVASWGDIGNRGKLGRIAACLKFGFRKNTVARTLGMWWAL